MTPPTTPLLSVDLRANYAGRTILRQVNFTLEPGEVLGLVGTSGAGKSTLVFSLLGLLGWRSGAAFGEVRFQGENLLALPEKKLRALRGRRIALVPQSPTSALNGALTLERHFAEAWRAHRSGARAELAQRRTELLGEVQLPTDPGFIRRRSSEISVGQAQRVLLALALLHRPELIIADEPTSALDPVTQVEIIRLLRRINRDHGTALLYISHDLLSVVQLCDRIAVLHGGELVETFPAAALGDAQHAATRSLLGTLPVPPEVLLRFRDRAQAEPSIGDTMDLDQAALSHQLAHALP